MTERTTDPDAGRLERFLAACLKPEEIAGAPDVRERRIRELLGWFARYLDRQANPKWFHAHAYEMVYTVAYIRFELAALRERAERAVQERDVLRREVEELREDLRCALDASAGRLHALEQKEAEVRQERGRADRLLGRARDSEIEERRLRAALEGLRERLEGMHMEALANANAYDPDGELDRSREWYGGYAEACRDLLGDVRALSTDTPTGGSPDAG